MSRPRIGIVGAGALGSYIGARLLAAGEDAHLLMRRGREAVAREGLTIEEADGSRTHVANIPVHGSAESLGPCDIVLVTLKTTANAQLPQLLAPLLRKDTLVLTLQNGLGNVEFLREQCGAQEVLGGLCFIGVVRASDTLIRNSVPNGGQVLLGDPDGCESTRLRAAADLLARAHIHVKTTADLSEALWRKLVWNVPFNGLTVAAGGVTCEVIVETPALAEAARGLMSEIQAAARTQGVEIEDDFLEKQLPFTAKLGPYAPSSLTDFRANRALEVEAIFGEPLRRGTATGTPMPLLGMLYGILGALGTGS